MNEKTNGNESIVWVGGRGTVSADMGRYVLVAGEHAWQVLLDPDSPVSSSQIKRCGQAVNQDDAKQQAESAYRRLAGAPVSDTQAPETPEKGQRIEERGNSEWSVGTIDGQVYLVHSRVMACYYKLTRAEYLQLRKEADEAFGIDPWGDGFPVEDAPEGEMLAEMENNGRFDVVCKDGTEWGDEFSAIDPAYIVRWWPLPTRREG